MKTCSETIREQIEAAYQAGKDRAAVIAESMTGRARGQTTKEVAAAIRADQEPMT